MYYKATCIHVDKRKYHTIIKCKLCHKYNLYYINGSTIYSYVGIYCISTIHNSLNIVMTLSIYYYKNSNKSFCFKMLSNPSKITWDHLKVFLFFSQSNACLTWVWSVHVQINVWWNREDFLSAPSDVNTNRKKNGNITNRTVSGRGELTRPEGPDEISL